MSHYTVLLLSLIAAVVVPACPVSAAETQPEEEDTNKVFEAVADPEEEDKNKVYEAVADPEEEDKNKVHEAVDGAEQNNDEI